MDLPERLERLVSPIVEALDFAVVRIQLFGQRRRRLQIMVERRDGKAMLVDDCATISREISAVLDVENPIEGAFTLEVSSPGIDRPLVRLDDFRRFAGLQAKVEMIRSIAGRRRFKGRLLGIEGEMVRIEVDGDTMDLAYGDIHRAKLILTDELLAAAKE